MRFSDLRGILLAAAAPLVCAIHGLTKKINAKSFFLSLHVHKVTVNAINLTFTRNVLFLVADKNFKLLPVCIVAAGKIIKSNKK